MKFGTHVFAAATLVGFFSRYPYWRMISVTLFQLRMYVTSRKGHGRPCKLNDNSYDIYILYDIVSRLQRNEKKIEVSNVFSVWVRLNLVISTYVTRSA